MWGRGSVSELDVIAEVAKKALTDNYFIRKLISSIITFLSRSLPLPLSLCLSLFISPHSTQSIQSSKFESLEEVINGF